MLKLIYFCLMVMWFTLNGWSQDSLPAQIVRDTVLTREGSPYYIKQNLSIAQGVTLEITPGVQCIISNTVSITNNGRLVVQGTIEDKVLFTSDSPDVRWRYISNNGSLFASHLMIQRATRFVTSYGDTVVIENCDVANTFGSVGDDCIGVHNAKKVMIRNTNLMGNPAAGKTDALDLDGISGDTIVGNHISGFSDDGIDIGTGSQNIVITDNVIDRCEMGVSIGESSTALVSKNLITNCIGGIQSHFGSVTNAQQNTLYGNSVGLRAFHNSSEETSGGTIHISNSIISNCILGVLTQKENSVVTISYCLTDSLLMPGTGNITGNPSFLDVEHDNFGLAPGSVAIDAGNPDNDNDGIDFRSDPDDTDPDGTRMDMGYFPYFNSPLKFVEISPSNLSLQQDESGEFSDWFKIINLSDTIINIKGYYLSDKQDNPYKYQLLDDLILSAGDTMIIWANDAGFPSNNNMPFKLSGEGEHLVLSNAKGIQMEEKTFSRVPVNYIYKRVGLSDKWVYSTWPADENAITYDSLCDDPVYSHRGGSSAFPVSVSLSSAYEADSVLYTINGADPVGGSLYKNSLTIQDPVTLRTVVKKENSLSGYIQAASFFPEKKYYLPVVSLSTNEDNLYGTTGIYTNYARAGPYWERPASFSYYDGSEHFTSIAGIRIQGGNSVFMPKKAFRLHFRGGYGTSALEASPFETGPPSFKNLVLRSGYDDDITAYNGTLLRDPYSNELWSQLGELATESAWSILLLNNNYWGIYNIRESINEYFVEDNVGIEDFDLIRFQKWGADLKYGTWDEWDHLVTYFDTTDFTRAEVYDEVSGFMDMNSLLNLLSLIHCSQFRSWTWGAFVTKPAGGRWSWTIWDTDRSYNILTWNGFTEYAYTNAEKWPNFIPQKLILNERFKRALINRNCDLMNSLFIPENAISVYDSLVSILTPEIDAEFERWNPGGRARWDTNNESIREFLRRRPSHVYNQMKSYFGITDTVEIRLRIVGKGKVKLNSLIIDQEVWQGTYMSGVPISLNALPATGSNFLEWEGISNIHFIEVDPGEVLEIIAVFDTTSGTDREAIVINEIMYHPLNVESSEWVELYNPNNYSVSLEGFEFTDGGINNQYVFPSNSIIDPLDFLIVAGDRINFSSEFGVNKTVFGSFNAGISGFNLSNDGENLYLKNTLGELEDQVHYNDKVPWPANADGLGPSLQLISPELDNNQPLNWYSSTTTLYSPGIQNAGNSTGDDHTVNPSSIHIYPNPVGETLFIDVSHTYESEIHIQIFTLTGMNIANSVFNTVDSHGTISWQHGITEPGAYILKVIFQHPEGNIEKAQLFIYSG